MQLRPHNAAAYKDRAVLVTGMLSTTNRVHFRLRRYVGRSAWLVGVSKNNQALLEFKTGYHTQLYAVPWNCIALRAKVKAIRL
jgi:hypothetical protein